MPGANPGGMGVLASSTLPVADAVTSVDEFLYAFASVYTLAILLYIVMSWLRLPYSVALNRFQRFLYDVCEPYLRLFRRLLPSFGALDLSPMIAIFALWIVEQLAVRLIDHFA